jgi:hypothetical protein
MPKHVINSTEYACLSAYAVKLLFDLFAQYNGRNNGDLSACWSLMHKRGWRSKATLHKATVELKKKGWIVVARQGGRNKASLYALTFRNVDNCNGKLDIAPTVVPFHWWQKNKNSTHNVYRLDPHHEQAGTRNG